ncbi:MAG TPA: 2-oxoacid:acceptor oxidoreductase subunit alpha [Bacteroidales bacterium]|jgi:2-oxoglutarate ferredoxin oxidoreductase subunit alpha|nr:2-oxoacid:acceptor oxidoreductase subunit alpha [Bacteroidales bacterium]
MAKKSEVIERDEVVIRFSGDSGDGMQLTGTLFSDTAALFGNDLSTFPDYPAEIRAPSGTVGGVSGFQVHLGHSEVYTPGDYADVLVAMNPAALKANAQWLKKGGTVIFDESNFNEKTIQKAGYTSNPITEEKLEDYNVIAAPISTMVKEALKDHGLDQKSVLRTKNMFALGMVYWLFDRKLKYTEEFFDKKFKNKPTVAEANKIALRSGYYYAETIEALTPVYKVPPANIPKGTYRNISGNTATAWGLLAAAEKSGLELFIGSYPITPATSILEELSARKDLGVKSFQAEDEIAGICTAIGASFAGRLAVTSTSGPGLALKSEAIGLAVMTELPLVIINVQRGGPSTGLPTKTEQSDLLQALFGRNGECPLVVIASSTPSDCFHFGFEAAKIALEHMTPVLLLSDSYLANGTEPWKIPSTKDLPGIKPPFAVKKDTPFLPYQRDEKTLVRSWAVPGMEGLEHRIGGLEKTVRGTVSYVPENHEKMVRLRAAKVEKVADELPELKVYGEDSGDLLVVGWGGSFGYLLTAVRELQAENHKVSLVNFNYINPLPKNTGEVFSKFKKIVVCELNLGQFASYLRMKYPHFTYEQHNKVQGIPFTVKEITEKCIKMLEEK